MSLELDSYNLHHKAWEDQENWESHLRNAIELLEENMELVESIPVLANNYGALLLEQNKNKIALKFLSKNIHHFQEYYLNLAIAYAKCNSSKYLENIRKYNGEAQSLPSSLNAIQAFINWQGL